MENQRNDNNQQSAVPSASDTQEIWFRNGDRARSQETLNIPLLSQRGESTELGLSLKARPASTGDIPRFMQVCFVLLIMAVVLLSIELAAISYTSNETKAGTVVKKSVDARQHEATPLDCERCETHYRPFCCRKRHGEWSTGVLEHSNHSVSQARMRSIARALAHLGQFLVDYSQHGVCFGVSTTGQVLSVHNVRQSMSEAQASCAIWNAALVTVSSMKQAAFLHALANSCGVKHFWFNSADVALSTQATNGTESTQSHWFDGGLNSYTFKQELRTESCPARNSSEGNFAVCDSPRPFICEHSAAVVSPVEQ